jgi:photosystem II stability/assembly factor-like uncharacterized protein
MVWRCEMREFIQKAEGTAYVRTEPLTPFAVLTCTGVGDVTLPRGDRTTRYVPDVRRVGRFVAAGSFATEPGAATVTLTRPLSSVYNYLLELDCPFTFRVNWACRGSRTDVLNYDVATVLFDAAVTSSTISAPVALQPDENDRVDTSADVSASRWAFVYQIAATRQTLAAGTDGVVDFAIAPSECGGPCGSRVIGGQIAYAVVNASAPYYVSVYRTANGGATWTAATAPFSNGPATSIVLVPHSTGYRLVVGRAAVTGEPAAVAISDDGGDTWSEIEVGSRTEQAVNRVTMDTIGRLWAACSGGYIYRSSDRGETWSAVEAGVATSEDLRDIAMASDTVGYAVGDAGTILYTADGSTWSAMVPPAAGVNYATVAASSEGAVFVGGNDGVLYGTYGGSWKALATAMGASVTRIRFDPDHGFFGLATLTTGAGSGILLRSEDGGATWYRLPGDYVPVNSGLSAVALYSPNEGYVGGASAFVAKIGRRA